MGGPLGQHQENGHTDIFSYPKLEEEVGPHGQLAARTLLVWSLNNYLGLANPRSMRKRIPKLLQTLSA